MPTQHLSGGSSGAFRFRPSEQAEAPPKLTAEEKVQENARMAESRVNDFFAIPAVAWSPLWLPLSIFLATRITLRRHQRYLRIITPSILAFATFAFCFLIRARWVFRDPFAFMPISGPNPDEGLPKPDEMNRLYLQSLGTICVYCGTLFMVGLLLPFGATFVRSHSGAIRSKFNRSRAV